MIPCPVCGKPMPKRRMELGYNYCVNCSTEGKKVCLVEGKPEGDSNQEEVVILSSQEAQAISRYRTIPKLEHIEDESPLNMQTYEEREAAEETLKLRDMAELEGEFGYEVSDRTARDMETIGTLDDAELEAEFSDLEEPAPMTEDEEEA